MKKIKVFASFLKLAEAKIEAKKQVKQLEKADNNFLNARVEVLNALKLWKTNKWTHQNPYGLPFPTGDDFLVCITYTVAQCTHQIPALSEARIPKIATVDKNKQQLKRIKKFKDQDKSVVELLLPYPDFSHYPSKRFRLAS